MCKKEPGEPAWAYIFRQFCEKPHAVLCCLALAAVCVMYVDMRGLFGRLVSKVDGMEAQLTELNVRIATIEHNTQR